MCVAYWAARLGSGLAVVQHGTCRWFSFETTLQTCDCWTAQRCVVVIPASVAVKHWTLPARSSLAVCRCHCQRSAHCRQRHRRWWMESPAGPSHHIHVYRMSAASRRSANKPWWCHRRSSNVWADCCWCSVLGLDLSCQSSGRWTSAGAILVTTMFRSVETHASDYFCRELRRRGLRERRRLRMRLV